MSKKNIINYDIDKDKINDIVNNDIKGCVARRCSISSNGEDNENKSSSTIIEEITNIDNFDTDIKNMTEEELDKYIINYDIYRPPMEFITFLDYYKENCGTYIKEKDVYIFSIDRVILLISKFFKIDCIANKIKLNLDIKTNVMNEAGCSCFKTIMPDEVIIRSITIGNVSLKLLNNGVCYNLLQTKHKICLTESYFAD